LLTVSDNALHIASPRAVDEEEADGDQRYCDGKSRRHRLIKDEVTGRDAK
jgi:hypothetical protein